MAGFINRRCGRLGATSINRRKLKQMGIAKKVFGFAVVGSLKGFEVIREV